MPTYKRPGVYAEEILTSSQVTGAADGTAVAAFVGVNGRGPTQTVGSATVGRPTLCTSWSDYINNFGGFAVTPSFATSAPTLPYSVYTFFANGGQNCYVVRAISAASSVAASSTFQDTAGTPQNTMKVTAINEGVWGNGLVIDITAGATGRFNLIIHFGDATASTIVERWLDLSMVATDQRYAPNIVNPSPDGSLGSDWVRLTDLGSASAGTLRNPAVVAGTALASGADGTAPANGDYTSAMSGLDIIDKPMVMNIDAVDATNINSAVTYCSGRGDVFLIVDPPAAQTVSQISTFAQTLTTTGYAALYYPRVTILDPANSTPGVTKTIAPGGAIAGLIQRTDSSRGVWKAPAGLSAKVLSAVAVERVLTNPELDTLNTAASPINAIRAIPGAGIVAMGARTLTTLTADKYVPNRRTLIFLKATLKQLTLFATFEPNNSILWDQITSVLQRYLTGFWQSGGLAGVSPLSAYYVKCDADINTPATVQAGEVHIEVGVALNYPAEFIVLRIGQTAAGASASEPNTV